MLELLAELPERVVGVRARGEVSAEDYRLVLVPAVEQCLSRFRRARLLYVLGTDFEGFSGGAAWEDAKVGMQHFASFERVAVVTDIEWVERMIRAFGIVLPGEVRVYGTAEFERARGWIVEPASPGRLDFELLRDKGVLVLEPKDELEAADFERVAAEVDPYIEQRGGLSGLVIIADEFPGWDDLAAFTSHMHFVRAHHRSIKRLAVVTGSRFLSALPRMASLFLDAQVRHFPPGARAQALAWAAGGE